MLLKALLSCAANSYNVRRYESDCDYIAKLDSEIRETPKFPLIKDRYEEAVKEYNRWGHIPIKDEKR
jgi:hypothetical protein